MESYLPEMPKKDITILLIHACSVCQILNFYYTCWHISSYGTSLVYDWFVLDVHCIGKINKALLQQSNGIVMNRASRPSRHKGGCLVSKVISNEPNFSLVAHIGAQITYFSQLTFGKNKTGRYFQVSIHNQ